MTVPVPVQKSSSASIILEAADASDDMPDMSDMDVIDEWLPWSCDILIKSWW